MEKKNYLSIALTVLLASGLIIGGVYAYRQSGGRAENGRAEIEKGADPTGEAKPTESDVDAIRQAFMEKYQKEESEVQVTIQKFDGNHARGGVKFAMLGQFGAGGIFLAYKDSGTWKLAFDGNGMISCADMAQYDFPADMTLGCFDEGSGAANPGAQLPNPASVNCADKGGELEIKTGEDGGQYGVCKFPDGSECEEWALLRGECEHAE